MSDVSRIKNIVARLMGPDLDDREAAIRDLDELGKQGLSLQAGRYALQAAAQRFPPRRYDYQNSSNNLLYAVNRKPRPEYVPLVVELFPQFNEETRQQAIRLLTEIEDRSAAVAFMDILRTHASTGGFPEPIVRHLREKPRYPEVFFPELLEYAANPRLTRAVCWLCLTYFEAGLLDSPALLPWLPNVLAVYAELRDKLFPLQESDGVAWMWEEEYRRARFEADVLLDLLGYFPSPVVEAELRRALDYQDPLLKCFAVISLLRLGKDVEPNHLLDVAASAEVRSRLYDLLAGLGKRELFPFKFCTQQALAESEMVRWLIYPTELASVPDEIELMDVVSFDTESADGFLDCYVFRFRTHPPHWAAEDGWMAGVAGPYLRNETPTTRSYGFTFSDFRPADSGTPQEHVDRIGDILQSWKEYRARERGQS